MIEKIVLENTLMAIVIRSNFQKEGIHFFTDNNATQQLGYMKRPAGYRIKPHLHLQYPRSITQTNEVLFIKSGVVKVNFYNNDRCLLSSSILNPLDVILLIEGGHGFEIIESAEIIEVKQGPYAGDQDKIKFEQI
jgi:mannose-6-phosphate isomerase-like protein (cupin superfamily)